MNGTPRAQAGIVPDNLLHFLHPWRSDAHDCRDAGGRAPRVGALGDAGAIAEERRVSNSHNTSMNGMPRAQAGIVPDNSFSNIMHELRPRGEHFRLRTILINSRPATPMPPTIVPVPLGLGGVWGTVGGDFSRRLYSEWTAQTCR